LNVVHHLREPVRALRMIAELCNEKLIIEFPVLSDEKFQSTLPDRQEFDPSLPLIGVSLLSEKDQTFLFSKEAINRILLEHDRLFSRIEFDQSPTSPDRCVAICYK
jgi:GH15 family glucan-1,4-alpha-glucosidase